MDPKQELLDALEQSLRDTGRDLGNSAEAIREYAAEQMAQLALGVGQPGHMDAAIAARDNIAIKAAIFLTDDSDAADQRAVGTIQTVLLVGAKLISGGAA